MGSKNLRPQHLRLALRASSGLTVGSIYPLQLERNVLGRSVDATVPLDDPKVSRLHATVDQQNGFHYLVDLGSINGTYLNGAKLEHATLISVGDEIRVGSTVLVVVLLEQARQNAPRNWRESTRAIMREPEVIIASQNPAREEIRIASQTGARWRHLLLRSASADLSFSTTQRRVFSLFIGIGLVLAAIATTFAKS